MTSKKTTRRALLSSVVALILCCSMLVGTTFAWFTDSVQSMNNVITAGNLDVDVVTADGNTIHDQATLFDGILWEPGVVAYETLTVKNVGTLALKYQMNLNFTNATATPAGNTLVDILKVGVVSNSVDANATREELLASVEEWQALESFSMTGELAATTDAAPVTVVIYWEPSSEDDLYNMNNENKGTVLSIDLGVHLFATQLEAESDSFGSDYDNGAFIPVAPEALPEEGEAIVLNGSAESKVTVTVPAAVVAGLDDEVTSLSVNASAPVVDTTNKTVSFTTVELVDQNGEKVDLTDSTAKVTVTLPVNGAFADGEEVEVYHDGSFVTYATVADGKISYETSHFCEVEVKSAEEVVLDNTIDSVKEFIAFANAVNAGNSYKGQTVVLGADLDLAGVTWTPIGTSANPFKGTFDGNGKVIKNLSVLMAGKSNVGLFGYTIEGEIKNVTVENAKVAGRLNVGVVAGTPYTSKYTNITVKGHVEVDGMAYVGTVGGKNAYADWTDITVNVDATSYVNAYSVENGSAYRTYVGGVVGFNGEGGHTFKNITSNINVFGSTCDVGGAFGIAHYGNKFENVTVTGNVTCLNETETEVGGVAGVWHNGGENVTFTNCKYEGKSNVAMVGSPYNATGNGKLIVDGNTAVAVAAGVVENGNTYEIYSAAGLKWVANEVNVNGNSFNGKNVVLVADIDLENIAWTSIGNWDSCFAGIFDGQNHTISNLYINAPEGEGVGLFGVVENAEIKNVTLKNVNITGYSMVAGVVGAPYPAQISNCHVAGEVNIVAEWAYVAGISGYNYYGTQVQDCTVIADETGLIKSNTRNAVGGITAWLLEGNHNVTNCHVKNLDLVGWTNVGGITGFVHYSNVIDGCSVENVNLVKTREGGNPGIGMIAGGWSYHETNTITISNNAIKNVSLTAQSKVYDVDADICQMVGSEYNGVTTTNFVFENNTQENITVDLSQIG